MLPYTCKHEMSGWLCGNELALSGLRADVEWWKKQIATGAWSDNLAMFLPSVLSLSAVNREQPSMGIRWRGLVCLFHLFASPRTHSQVCRCQRILKIWGRGNLFLTPNWRPALISFSTIHTLSHTHKSHPELTWHKPFRCHMQYILLPYTCSVLHTVVH